MNELDLIKEVEKRPILYDKSMSGFNKTKLRDDAWRQVQDALNVSETECKKRWRSLRDSFIKLQRTRGGRTRWPYHNVMRFLLPHVVPESKADSDSIERGKNTRKRKASDSDAEEEERQRAIQVLPDLPDLSYMQAEVKFEDESPEPSPKKARLSCSDDDTQACMCNRTDPDELFLLSCAPTLKRLHPKQNAVARLKIQQALYEAEFGVRELPYSTPSSDCGFSGKLE